MEKFITEFDQLEAALKKVNLNEEVLPQIRGHFLTENVETYVKIQKILNCNPMQSCHKWLYDLDVENLDESEINKVNNLYKLGCNQGYIEDDEGEDDANTDAETEKSKKTDECDMAQCVQPEKPQMQPVATQTSNCAFTVLYSAMRDGQIKTGEAYSNSINPRSAKADVINKLEKAGYQNVSILAIEAGDPDAVGCDNTYVKLPDTVVKDYSDGVETTTCQLGNELNHVFDAQVNEEDGKDDSDDKSDEEDDKKDDGKDDGGEEDKSSEDKDDASDKEDDKKNDEKEEDSEEPDEKLKDGKDDSDDKDDEGKSDDSDDEGKSDEEDDKKDDEEELSTTEKAQLKDSYKKAFKAALQKCKFTTSFSELTLDQKVQFFTELSKAWTKKADPSKFMTDKEVEQLEKIVVKKESK